ncbi:protein CURLY FLAG LEAF 1-like [Typha angustifolia]|uniref:protein CURLY FLAG LEAF 1-like n=1 Tax=Typha angustifolia TaxID=59011 RepID=UPI003C2D0A10
MTAPNIDMITTSLRNCSLGARGGSRPSLSPAAPQRLLLEGSDESEGVTVELNSEMALPYNWEQCLDMRTGQVYYVNWEDGTRTTVDPRTTFQSTYYYSDDEDDGEEDDDDDDEDDDDEDEDEDDESSDEDSARYSTLSSSSPAAESSRADSGGAAIAGETLVAVGCKSCFMYFMVPKRVDCCPKCGGHLIHLGRNGCV